MFLVSPSPSRTTVTFAGSEVARSHDAAPEFKGLRAESDWCDVVSAHSARR
jgi:hypothetical protein